MLAGNRNICRSPKGRESVTCSASAENNGFGECGWFNPSFGQVWHAWLLPLFIKAKNHDLSLINNAAGQQRMLYGSSRHRSTSKALAPSSP